MSVRSRPISAILKAPPASLDLSRRRSRCTLALFRQAFIAENSIRQSLGPICRARFHARPWTGRTLCFLGWPASARLASPARTATWCSNRRRRLAPCTVPACRRPVQLLPLSAKSPEALRALAQLYAELLSAEAAPALHDVCWNAATRRTALDHRAVFVAADRAAMADALRGYASGEAAAAEGVVRADASPRIAFVLPGQGAQWIGMARELIAREPAFRAALERCDQAARRFVDWSIMGQLAAAPDFGRLLADAYRCDPAGARRAGDRLRRAIAVGRGRTRCGRRAQHG